jgi:hypothetical protein
MMMLTIADKQLVILKSSSTWPVTFFQANGWTFLHVYRKHEEVEIKNGWTSLTVTSLQTSTMNFTRALRDKHPKQPS